MNIIKSQSLGAVVLPLVQVMADADLSWSDREKISAAIHKCHRQWTDMEKERQSTNAQLGSLHGQQHLYPGGLPGNQVQAGQ
jgi:hypothetical protein